VHLAVVDVRAESVTQCGHDCLRLSGSGGPRSSEQRLSESISATRSLMFENGEGSRCERCRASGCECGKVLDSFGIVLRWRSRDDGLEVIMVRR
jgi:hypothetical protein